LGIEDESEDPVPPSYRTELPIPRAVDDLVMMCLEKDRSRRPRDADDLQQRAASCVGVERWDPLASRRWWEAHLPDLARPRAIALPDTDHSWVRASASCAL
jgi:serine/threonine-protein kinase